ncbi:putative cytosol aminopeptidase [Anatilimnocola aggregata]|uniref:Probable cytosol aminopeptidase n=1 Tax=Anatilimnocola aggregata TaxID=2528021 RepID=A0A517Y5I7_9BACT|nr:leucyl aminopeptidase [Anatilimnocola aggregata]QDU25511.1 putative cytosol aminopeptidase [Anatilimnocola aggregata]
MAVTAIQDGVATIQADAVVVGIYADEPLSGAAEALNRATQGLLTKLLESKDLSGKRGEVVTLFAPPGTQAKQATLIGLGARATVDRSTAFRSAAIAAKALAGKERGLVAFYLGEGWSGELLESGICGSLVGCVGQDLYRAKKNRFPLAQLGWANASADDIRRGEILAGGVNLARRLVNEPAGDIYPESFANEAVSVAESSGLSIEVWDRARLEAERCGSLLAVGKGSDRDSRLVILKYQGAADSVAPIAFVGKGVTFDSGGLSIKPTDGMKTMKCDMAGAAAVLGAMQTIAQLQLPVNVIGFCGLVENMLGGSAFKLGDVLRARSGKTIEVLNTDAEGRLVLGDVLDVALQSQPAKIVDLATLTGACVVALGTDIAGLMTNDQAWADEVKASGDAVGEPLWQLPMYPEFSEQIRSEVADIKNTGDGRWGGAITAAKFLEEFVAGKPWVHLDIAGPAFLDGQKPWLDAGGSGFGVRTLVEIARRAAK